MHAVCERHLPFLAELRTLLPPRQIIWTHMEEHEDTLAPNLPVYPNAGPRRFCVRGTPGFDYHIVQPAQSEAEVLKFHLSAFHKDAQIHIVAPDGTPANKVESSDAVPLHAYLQNLGIDTIAFTGVFATRCVYASIVGASTLGYNCVCLSDLVGVPGGAFFEREKETHDLTQNMLYSYALSSQEFLSGLRGQ